MQHSSLFTISGYDDRTTSGRSCSRKAISACPRRPRPQRPGRRGFPVGDIGGLSLWEGDRKFLPHVLEGRTGLDMTLRYEGDRLVACEE